MPKIHDFQGFLSLMGLPTLPGRENQYLNPNNFNTPHRMIEFNLYWEWKAIEGYVRDRDKAMSLGDMKTAELFTHIMGEEEEHFNELLKRYNELVSKINYQVTVTRALKAQGKYESPDDFVRRNRAQVKQNLPLTGPSLDRFIVAFMNERPDSAFSSTTIQNYITRQGWTTPSIDEIDSSLRRLVSVSYLKHNGVGMYSIKYD